MKRFHALEWEDLHWFPKSWRNFGTDYLQFISNKFDIYKSIIPILEKGFAAGNGGWLDCASGGGGGLLKITEHLAQKNPNIQVTISDYFPNIQAFERTKKLSNAKIDNENSSVNAMDIPQKHHGKFRTMFASFHHFKPKNAQQILQNAIDTDSPIAIFEPVDRNFMSWFSMFFVIPNVLILTPFIRPFRWKLLIFIYLIPFIPLFILWDGIASILRIYSENELKEMIKQLKNNDKFEWEIGKSVNGPASTLFLLGIPKK